LPRCSVLGGGATTAGFGIGAVADLTLDILPLDIMYIVQNAGAPFETAVGTSVVLNLLLYIVHHIYHTIKLYIHNLN